MKKMDERFEVEIMHKVLIKDKVTGKSIEIDPAKLSELDKKYGVPVVAEVQGDWGRPSWSGDDYDFMGQ